MAGGANRLSSASARGDLAEVEMLLQNGADVNENNVFGRTPLQVGSAFYFINMYIYKFMIQSI